MRSISAPIHALCAAGAREHRGRPQPQPQPWRQERRPSSAGQRRGSRARSSGLRRGPALSSRPPDWAEQRPRGPISSRSVRFAEAAVTGGGGADAAAAGAAAGPEAAAAAWNRRASRANSIRVRLGKGRAAKRASLFAATPAEAPTLLDDLRKMYVTGEEERRALEEGSFFYTPKALLQREAARLDGDVRALLGRFWALATDGAGAGAGAGAGYAAGAIPKNEYVRLHRALYRALHSVWDPAEALRFAEEDWERDRKGAGAVDRDRWALSIFELADRWTDSLEKEAAL
eukprot:tig00000455_g1049.t1